MALPTKPVGTDVILPPPPPTDVRGRFSSVISQVDQLLYDGWRDCDDVERAVWVLLLAQWLRGELLVTYGEIERTTEDAPTAKPGLRQVVG